MTPKLEIACFNLESALIAAKAGADRLEICINRELGGTTPDWGMVKVAKQKIAIPLYIMIRPRGGDFNYSKSEFEQMKKEISAFKSLKVDGFVFGILNHDKHIDLIRNSELVCLAKPIPCTFHRAFDLVSEVNQSLEMLIECGFNAVLTSGKCKNAIEGLTTINQLIKQAKRRIQIIPGGGIRSANIQQMLAKINTNFYHTSAIIKNESLVDANEILAFKKALAITG
jgi:copper homeostasis protein